MKTMNTDNLEEMKVVLDAKCMCPGNNCTCKCEDLNIDVNEELKEIYK